MLRLSVRPALLASGLPTGNVPKIQAAARSEFTAAAGRSHPLSVVGVGRSTRPLSDKTAKGPAPAAPSSSSAASEPKLQTRVDPHQMASEFIKASPESRTQGTEALASLTPEQRMRNFGLAAALVGFVTWVWWYSMNSVGRPEGGFEGLEAEAAEAREAAERKTQSEKEAVGLADLDVTAANLDGQEVAGEGGELTVAVAAPEAIAQEEEDRNLAAAAAKIGSTDKASRPLWKKIVFFWRRD